MGNGLATRLADVWTASNWQGESPRRRFQWWCSNVFGLVFAVHVNAGHNVLRGPGPGHKLAFDNALALVGSPDRRIDRLYITRVRPANLLTAVGVSRSCRQCDGLLVALALAILAHDRSSLSVRRAKA